MRGLWVGRYRLTLAVNLEGKTDMLLLIDNYDSFTYNLYQYLAELGADITVYRNNQVTLEQIEAMQPDHIVISPGPCTPNEAGLSCQIIHSFGTHIPTLGVCLGHQAIGQVYGGKVVRAPEPMHGKTTLMYHQGQGVFKSTLCHLQLTVITASLLSVPLSRMNWRSPPKRLKDWSWVCGTVRTLSKAYSSTPSQS